MQAQGSPFVSFEPATWSRVRRFLARRLPASMVEDVAQSTACEAWANRERAEGHGFVFGIARNEAHDARRKEPRSTCEALSDEDDHGHVAEATYVHAELSEVMSYVERTPRLQTPMRWLVAEHAGESFEEIGAREGVAPAAVRQRVSRLRRELRAVFAGILALALGLCAWSVLAPVPRDAAVEVESVRMPLADGTWTILSLDSPDTQRGADAARSLLLGAKLEVVDGRGTLVTGGASGVPIELAVERDHGGLYLSGHGQRAPLHVTTIAGGQVSAKVGNATLTLVRAR